MKDNGNNPYSVESYGICKPREASIFKLLGVFIKMHPNQKWEYEKHKDLPMYRVVFKGLISLELNIIQFEDFF